VFREGETLSTMLGMILKIVMVWMYIIDWKQVKNKGYLEFFMIIKRYIKDFYTITTGLND
jgi:hypothetical protein